MESIIVHISNSEITNRAAVRKLFEEIKKKDGKYELQPRRINKRSDNQNRYYWGCCVTMIRDRMIELGNDVDSELVHCYLKDRFNSKELFNKDGVNIGSVGDTTTKLNKSDFELYLEKVKQFASEALDVIIPDPNTPITLFQ